MNTLESIIGKKVFYSYKSIMIENYMNANDYYILSGNMEEYATMLLDWSSHGYESEIDLFLLRPILQSLFLYSFHSLDYVLRRIFVMLLYYMKLLMLRRKRMKSLLVYL